MTGCDMPLAYLMVLMKNQNMPFISVINQEATLIQSLLLKAHITKSNQSNMLYCKFCTIKNNK